MPPTRNSFHELCDSSPIQEKKEKNSQPQQSSTNLHPLH